MRDRALYLSFLFSLLSWSLHAQNFTEKAKELGIDHYISDSKAMGGGVAIFDFNNDGLEDIYLTGGDENDQLYENLGNDNFREVTEEMGITQFRSVKTMGVVAGDVDNDGFTDLFITTAEGARCYLLKNLEGKSFTNIAPAGGITHEAWSMTATMGDYDLDGDLDIYVGNYVAYDNLPFDQNITSPLADFFYENKGDGTFLKIDNPLASNEKGTTLVSSFSDIDQDGDADLFVLNDFGDFYEPNKVLVNNYPERNFSNISNASGMNAAINSMGIAVGDFNEDGNFDYYVTNIGHNKLYQNQGLLSYEDVARDINVSDGTGVCWGAAFLDVNNDGHLDLYASKGSLLNLNDTQNNLLYLGFGKETRFENVSETLVTKEPNKARGMAYGDLNNDGRLDMIAVNIRVSQGNLGSTKIYMNSGSEEANWLKVKLEGTENNRSGYGALVKIYTDGKEQIREVSGGSSYLSVHSSIVHFGLGQLETVDSLVVKWPKGHKREVFKNLEANTDYFIKEDEGIFKRAFETIQICQGDEITIGNQTVSEEGVYTELITEGENNTVKLTKLVVNTDGTGGCSLVTVPSEENIDGREIVVYPSPFNNMLRIVSGVAFEDNVSIILSDVSGHVVRNQMVNSKAARGSITISGYETLPAGLYVLKIVSGNTTYIRKIVKS
ncbi:FG-GAP-like repeat-containing protein [Zobellia nedashkovskayae]|uniref:FG-GAP-like repeat-containing protein n=1 Tax=Zobellia nedashkovskayae TaxID=2779510 RepID=UPI00188CFABD|nr:FG-GAP-like repeat-containing protein [Zobellia nedashkovskayae]